MTTEINILGPGCYKCRELVARAELAVEELHLAATVRHVHDYQTYMTHGILFTPGLVIDGKLVSAGRVLTVKQIRALLEPMAAQQSALSTV